MVQLLNKRYQFIQTLGSDASGYTALVGDLKAQGHPRRVVKQLKLPTNNPHTLELSLVLLRKKAESLKAIGSHPQIPQIFDFFYESQSFYLVEEFFAGQSLDSKLQPGQPWAIAPTLHLLRSVLEVLQFVHERNTIHLSIQPSNLIERQSDGRIVVTGFGVFREISAHVLRAQGQVATASRDSAFYIAPEQALGKAQPSSDLYALGAIAIQALSGKTPDELHKLKNAAGTQPGRFEWARELNLEPSLVAAIDRFVCPDPRDRYPTAAAALRAIAPFSNSLPAAPPPPPPPRRLESNGKTTANGVRPPASLAAPERAELSLPAAESPPETNSPPPAASSPSPRQRRWRWGWGAIAGLLVVGAIAGLGFELPQRALSYYFWQRGNAAYARDAWEQAEAAYTRALRWQPDSGRAYLGLGLAQRNLNNFQASLEALTAAIQHAPDLAEAYYQRGNVRFIVGDRQGAIEDYTAAIARRPNFAAAYVNRGNARADAGDDPQALADYNQAIELDDSLAAAYLNRCLSRSNLDDQAGAIEDCNRAISLQPTSPLAYQNRALARRRLGDPQGALADYNIAIELDPNDADPYYNRGLARQDLGDLQGAIADFTTAIELDPDHALVYHDRGLAYARIGNRDEAIADFQVSAQRCLSSGRLRCYEDAKYELAKLGASQQEIQSILEATTSPRPAPQPTATPAPTPSPASQP